MDKSIKLFWVYLGATFLVWWSGAFGSDLFVLPGLFWLVLLSLWVKRGSFQANLNLVFHQVQNILLTDQQPKLKKLLYASFAVQVIIWLALFWMQSSLSFDMSTWDAGIYHNLVANFANGEFYSSIAKINYLGDHFSPIFGIFAPLYKIYESPLWILWIKILCIGLTPLALRKLILFEIEDRKTAEITFFFLTCLWLFFYKPTVSAMSFTIQPTNFGPPMAVLAMLFYRQKKYIPFTLSLLFLLSLKEHMGGVLIGFGFYMILVEGRILLGSLFGVLGAALIGYLMFVLMPEIRALNPNFPEGLAHIHSIQPFQQIPKKLFYLVKLLLPLGFLPLLGWRYGALAVPLIGVNLLGKEQMYSVSNHYDDIPSALLFIAFIFVLRDWKNRGGVFKIPESKKLQSLLIVGVIFFFHFLPSSPLRWMRKTWPTAEHAVLKKEVQSFQQQHPTASLVAQDALILHLQRREIQALMQTEGKKCDESFSMFPDPGKVEFILISEAAPEHSWTLPERKTCIQELKESKKLELLQGYQQLMIFRVKDS